MLHAGPDDAVGDQEGGEGVTAAANKGGGYHENKAKS
jgi:hypothetical protein